MLLAWMAVTFTVMAGIALALARKSPLGVAGVVTVWAAALEILALQCSSDLAVAALPFFLTLVVMALTAPASSDVLDEARKHEAQAAATAHSSGAATDSSAAAAPERQRGLGEALANFQIITSAGSGAILAGGLALLPFAFHVEGTGWEAAALIVGFLAVLWLVVYRSRVTGTRALPAVTVLLALLNLGAVLVCWLISYGRVGKPQEVVPVAADVITQSSATEVAPLAGDGATYVVDLTVPSVEALHGRIVWAANVSQRVDRGLDLIPAVAYADTPCYQASGSHWKCDPLHLGECKDLLNGGTLGTYKIYVVLLTAREVHQLRTNQQGPNSGAIPIDLAQALDPIPANPQPDAPSKCPRGS